MFSNHLPQATTLGRIDFRVTTQFFWAAFVNAAMKYVILNNRLINYIVQTFFFFGNRIFDNLVKKFTAFCWKGSSVTLFTKARHWSLFWPKYHPRHPTMLFFSDPFSYNPPKINNSCTLYAIYSSNIIWLHYTVRLKALYNCRQLRFWYGNGNFSPF